MGEGLHTPAANCNQTGEGIKKSGKCEDRTILESESETRELCKHCDRFRQNFRPPLKI